MLNSYKAFVFLSVLWNNSFKSEHRVKNLLITEV